MTVHVKYCEKCKGDFVHEWSVWKRKYVCGKCMAPLLDAEHKQGE